MCVLEWEYTPTSDVVGIQDKKKELSQKSITLKILCVAITENVVYCKLFYFSLYVCYSVSSCLSPSQQITQLTELIAVPLVCSHCCTMLRDYN